jgi:uncharacterized protein (DUF4415 family)
MTARKRSIGSDLAKADAHVMTAEDYEDNPELTEKDFARAVPHIGGRRVSEAEFRKAWDKAGRIGRPRSANPKKAVTLRLDPDVVAHFRATGPGWQTRINETLRQAAHLSASRKAAVSAVRKPAPRKQAKPAAKPLPRSSRPAKAPADGK